MLNGVNALKRIMILLMIVSALLLKLLIPTGAQLQRKVMDFLGLEREAVQALGRGMYESAP